jgi:NAD(P)-dependent dehydrogenase (short-subunit alcohol dehydrogenase family)
MSTVLVTGAGRGIGHEFARQYAADGWTVIATVRDAAKGAALAALGRTVEVHLLDVTDRAAIDRLARDLKGQAIDLLLCNAGIYGPSGGEQEFGAVEWGTWAKVLETNVMAPLALAEAFVDHVAASEKKLIVMISSSLGSIGESSSGGAYMYRSSKAALNAIAKDLSIDLGHRSIIVVAVNPGWVKTDMGGSGANLTPETSVGCMRELFARLKGDDTGKFFDYSGMEIPW